jgi:hypothetical protein
MGRTNDEKVTRQENDEKQLYTAKLNFLTWAKFNAWPDPSAE